MLRPSLLLFVLAVSTAAPAAVAFHVGPLCPPQPTHTYHGWAGGAQDSALVPSVTLPFVAASDSNLGDCAGGIPYVYDGDLDLGVNGGAFGYGPWAVPCGHHLHGGTYVAFDVVWGPAVAFWVGADDEPFGDLGPCLTNGVIAPALEADDCLHGPYVGVGPAFPCAGGGDGLIWIIFDSLFGPPPVAGTITAV